MVTQETLYYDIVKDMILASQIIKIVREIKYNILVQ